MMSTQSSILKSLYFIISLNLKLPDDNRRLSDMIDSYFLGFQAALLKFDPQGMKKTLTYILENNLEQNRSNAGIAPKLRNYENQMEEAKSINDIVPFDLEYDQVEGILENIEKQLNKKEQEVMKEASQKILQQQQQLKKQEQPIPQIPNQKPKPQEEEVWKLLQNIDQQEKKDQQLNQQQELLRQLDSIPNDKQFKPDFQQQQLKKEIPKQQVKQEQLLKQENPQGIKLGAQLNQQEIALDTDPKKLLGKILDDLKQNQFEKQAQIRPAPTQPQKQQEPIPQPQKVVPQQQPQQQAKKVEQQQQKQQPIIQKAQLPVIEQINDITPPEQKVIMKLVQQHLKNTHSKKNNCTICLTEMTEENNYQLTKCKHVFHFSCLKEYGENQSEIPIVCPQQGCKTEYSPEDLAKTISKKKRETLDQHSFNKFVLKNQQEYFQCPTPNCQSVYLIEGQFQICTNCQQMFCTKCRQEFHDGDCGDDKFAKIAMRDNYSQCLKCFHWVEKIYGCNHIKCVCGHQFCYNCQKEWVGEECKCIEEEQYKEQQQMQQQQAQDFNQLLQNLMQAAKQKQRQNP